MDSEKTPLPRSGSLRRRMPNRVHVEFRNLTSIMHPSLRVRAMFSSSTSHDAKIHALCSYAVIKFPSDARAAPVAMSWQGVYLPTVPFWLWHTIHLLNIASLAPSMAFITCTLLTPDVWGNFRRRLGQYSVS